MRCPAGHETAREAAHVGSTFRTADHRPHHAVERSICFPIFSVPSGARPHPRRGISSPSERNCLARNGLKSTPAALPPPRWWSLGSPGDTRSPPASPTMAPFCWPPTAPAATAFAERRVAWCPLCRVAARQLPPGRRAHPRRSAPICPRATTASLPKLAEWSVRGLSARVRHEPGRSWRTPTAAVDLDMLRAIIAAYQEVQPLTIGELWAVSITLRIVLIENLRRLAEADRRRPDRPARRRCSWPTGCSAPAGHRASRSRACSAHMSRARSRTPSPSNWCTGCATRTRGSLRLWSGSTSVWRPRARPPTRVVRDVHRSQGASNVTVRNIITSLRLISDLDWPDLFERTSLVHALLSAGSAYRRHGFPDPQSLPQTPSSNWRAAPAAPSSTLPGHAIAARRASLRCASRSGAAPA